MSVIKLINFREGGHHFVFKKNYFEKKNNDRMFIKTLFRHMDCGYSCIS